jgi:hypothetical protein
MVGKDRKRKGLGSHNCVKSTPHDLRPFSRLYLLKALLPPMAVSWGPSLQHMDLWRIFEICQRKRVEVH